MGTMLAPPKKREKKFADYLAAANAHSTKQIQLLNGEIIMSPGAFGAINRQKKY